MKNKNNDFENGELIVPEERLNMAFYYDEIQSVLYEDVVYRRATVRERIFYEKTLKSTMGEIKTFEKYKSDKSGAAGKAYESFEKSRKNFPK